MHLSDIHSAIPKDGHKWEIIKLYPIMMGCTKCNLKITLLKSTSKYEWYTCKYLIKYNNLSCEEWAMQEALE